MAAVSTNWALGQGRAGEEQAAEKRGEWRPWEALSKAFLFS